MRGTSLSARLGMTRQLSGDFFQHLRVGREFFDEHEQALNRFFEFMARQATSDQIDLKLVKSLDELWSETTP
jgi:hypothetical protein